MTTLLFVGVAILGINQNALANTFSNKSLAIHTALLQSTTQEVEQKLEAQIMLAAGIDTRVERRHDAVENTADRVEDKQDFREERRDCR